MAPKAKAKAAPPPGPNSTEAVTYKDNLHSLLMTNLISKQQHNDIIMQKFVAVITTKIEDMEMEDVEKAVETIKKMREINNIEEYKEINEILKN